ncbi:transmembrane protein 267 isoform X2 [Cryptotermes secundus]|uniref:transmembrane protein 267 isoform X2 n=1 Tax=Cryptotermes secundus TaxID=105785 RepID=UPI000CD7B9B7|nr:transmembrane protein 267 isoform X2 [Cryptotermes secundus]XP_033608008.1 transmembrane protein 267 isoform X2 [Cryptotermes secundus]
MLSVVDLLWTNKTVATVCLGLVALLGDHVVTHYTQYEDVQAVADNLTHGAIGLLTWHIVRIHLAGLSLTTQLSEILLCGLLASAIDLDHFAAARSFRIQDARQLPSRPPLHCTSVMLAVCGILLLLSFTFRWVLLHCFSWILIAAVLSHHLRDATRRGLWMYPFGSSPPIPYAGYMVGCMLLPHVLPSLVGRTQPAPQHATLYSVVEM